MVSKIAGSVPISNEQSLQNTLRLWEIIQSILSIIKLVTRELTIFYDILIKMTLYVTVLFKRIQHNFVI